MSIHIWLHKTEIEAKANNTYQALWPLNEENHAIWNVPESKFTTQYQVHLPHFWFWFPVKLDITIINKITWYQKKFFLCKQGPKIGPKMSKIFQNQKFFNWVKKNCDKMVLF